MDAKDLRTEAALSDRSNDGNTKYAQSGGAVPCHRNKTYQDIGSNSLGKVDVSVARPCAVIGPDRVVPPTAAAEAYLKKGPVEPWLATDNAYRRPPEYPHKVLDYPHPTRNISPRQTFQENMQRIMVAPTYSSVKTKEDHSFPGDPSISQMRLNKINVSSDSNPKYCDVPYNINPMINEHKNVRNMDSSAANMNTMLPRSAPHGWPPASTNLRPPKPYHQELFQYPDYPSSAAPRSMLIPRPPRNLHEEPGPVYPDGYFHDGNLRFKPYPTSKDRYPQSRYEFVSNYPNTFHPPHPFPSHKYDIQKAMPAHPYTGYPQVPKYVDGRITEPVMNGYQRPVNPPPNYNNMPYFNQVIHPNYGPIPGNCLQTNKFYPYPADNSKSISSNKLTYDASGKSFTEFENNRVKSFPLPEGFYVNDVGTLGRPHPIKGQVLPLNYPTNVHAMPSHPYYRKENIAIRGYDYNSHFRNMDPSLNVSPNALSRLPSNFSPTTVAISPSDSHINNDTNQNHVASQEDCGYVSQSSSTSARSIDSNMNRFPTGFYRRYDPKYLPMGKTLPAMSKHESHLNADLNKKKDIDVRQFLQMWNEGEEDNGENNNKDVVPKPMSNNHSSQYENNTQQQLYVLGLVNVPNEELSKYEHIQKVSKLPENIKGYNSIELLHQFEEVIESSNLSNFNSKPLTPRDFHTPLKGAISMHGISIPSRPLSPLDVEAKISQSVIHKEVGCNFEIKPCSPKMLNAELATPVQSVFTERAIEKVSNPLNIQAPIVQNVNENRDNCSIIKCHDHISESTNISSCKMVSTQYNDNDPVDSIKTNYSLQDLESNSGVCLASLPRLDNDIELNFPEVNQQFINANKVKSSINSSSSKDLPTLDIDQSDRNIIGPESTVSNSNIDKDHCKLSKYRKISKKRNIRSHTSDATMQALRTDSVIIKNPDNIKNHEVITETSPKRKSEETQHDPINLSVNTDPHGHLEESTEKEYCDSALDFSFNSSDNCGFNNEKIMKGNFPHENHNLESNVSSKEHEIITVSKKKEPKLTEDFPSTLNENCYIKQQSSDISQNTSSDVDLDSNVDKIQITDKEECSHNSMSDTFSEKLGTNSDTTNTFRPDQSQQESIVSYAEPTSGVKDMSQDSGLKKETILNKTFKDCSEDIKNNLSISQEARFKQDDPSTEVGIPPEEETQTLKQSSLNIDVQPLEKTSDIKKQNYENVFEISQVKTECEAPKNKSTDMKAIGISKKLWSPWIQKLFIYREGVCSSNKIVDSTDTISEIKDCNNSKSTLVAEDENENLVCSENASDSVMHDLEVQMRADAQIMQCSLTDKDVIKCVDFDKLENKSTIKVNEKEMSGINFNRPATPSDTNESSDNTLNINSDVDISAKNGSILGTIDNNLTISPEIQEVQYQTPSVIYFDSTDGYDSSNTNCAVIDEEDTLTDETTSSSSDEEDSDIDENVEGVSGNLKTYKNKSDDISEVKTFDSDIDVLPEFPANTQTSMVVNNKENDKINTELLDVPTEKKNADTAINLDSITDTLYSDSNDLLYISKDIILSEKRHADELVGSIDKTPADDVLQDNIMFEVPMTNSQSSTFNIDKNFELEDYEANHKVNVSLEITTEEQSQVVTYDIDAQNQICDTVNTETLPDQNQCNKEIGTDVTILPEKLTTKLNDQNLTSGTCNRRTILKRSYSDSALDNIRDNLKEDSDDTSYSRLKKRKRTQPDSLFKDSYCNIIQTHRRNSLSSIQNADNVSLCILIENDCILTEEDEESNKICFAEMPDECIACVQDPMNNELEPIAGIVSFQEENNCDTGFSHTNDIFFQEILEPEPWVEDVACIETVVADDIAENIVISASTSPKDNNLSDGEFLEHDDDSELYNINEHTDKLKYIYGAKMCSEDSHLVDTLYRTPQMNVDKTLNNRESHIMEDNSRYYDKESLEKVLSGSNINDETSCNLTDYEFKSSPRLQSPYSGDKENLELENFNYSAFEFDNTVHDKKENNKDCFFELQGYNKNFNEDDKIGAINLCESNMDEVLTHNKNVESPKNTISSSPEVSSTTSEERNSGIFLKISNYGGSIVSQVNDIIPGNRISCKYTEKKDYLTSNNSLPRTLITKAAQKYIPPLKETTPNLKVKLQLPQHSLTKLKQLKLAKETLKPNFNKTNSNTCHRQDAPKKSKPKFEDVLRSIDEMQFQKHKEKNREKKVKKSIPKVVIKKNENGSHYASTSNKDRFNPDLTGRKWQPWVFLERNNFIDKMALRRKTKAIFSHRKNTYVLAEKFQKYKSIESTKFIISQPKSDCSTGQLKYTIKLKHNY